MGREGGGGGGGGEAVNTERRRRGGERREGGVFPSETQVVVTAGEEFSDMKRTSASTPHA